MTRTTALPRATVLVLVLAGGLGGTAGAPADEIQRCESKDKRITYSNTTCPDGTVATRKVNTEPPVSVDDRKAAQDRVRRDTAAVRQIDKDQAQQEVRERRQADDRAKADAKAKERCDAARRDVDKARLARGEMNARAYPAEKLQKADLEIDRREAVLTRACAR
jgi:hypothetical protein